MAYEYPILDLSFPASADLSGNQYNCVGLTTAGKVQVLGTTGTGFLDMNYLGVLQDKTTAANLSCKVRVEGVSKVVLGCTSGLEMAVLPGAPLVSTGGGVLPSSSGAANHIIGIALEACATFSASTSYIRYTEMLITRHGIST